MGIREWLNRNRGLAVLLVAVLVLAAVVITVRQVLASRKTYPEKLPDSFFTVDDGKTFFAYGSENIPPFDYNGQPAVHAYVFQCNGMRFVGYMERYTPEARGKIIAQKHSSFELETYGRELKRPGEKAWTKASDAPAVVKLTDVKCPDGKGTPEPIEP